jgi:hypothetical protein
MKKVLLGMVAVAVLVGLPMMVALAAEDSAKPKVERPPEIVLTDAQKKELARPIAAFEDALKGLREAAVHELGDNDGKAFVLQTIRKAMIAGRAEGKAPGGERKPGRGPDAPK